MYDMTPTLPAAAVQVRITHLKAAGIPFNLTRVSAVGWPCPYCWALLHPSSNEPSARQAATHDHVVPLSRGGPDARGNILPCCKTCNNDKANLHPAEWLGVLRADGDPRARCVEFLIETLIEDWPQDLMAEVYATIGRNYAARRRWLLMRVAAGLPVPEVFSPVAALMPPEAIRQFEEKRRDGGVVVHLRPAAVSIEDRIAAIMEYHGVPRTHWTFVPPRIVRVLIGSVSERFAFTNAATFSATIRSALARSQTRKVSAR